MDYPGNQSKSDMDGEVIVVTGGAGILCTPICKFLTGKGAKVAILDIQADSADHLLSEIAQAGGDAIVVQCDVTDRQSLTQAAEKVIQAYGNVYALINGAGGNNPQATTRLDLSFFDLPEEALHWVINLNLIGTMLASQSFGKVMAREKRGNIINISSLNSIRPLTRIPFYSAAKAGVSNFTQWLAVHMAQEYSPEIRVNAIAPGFFMTAQNRYLLFEKGTDTLTDRGLKIIEHTPMKRFGIPEDLISTVAWLLSPSSAFVTGIVVPVDGGFSAFSGV